MSVGSPSKGHFFSHAFLFSSLLLLHFLNHNPLQNSINSYSSVITFAFCSISVT
jgi:hypothetical protein